MFILASPDIHFGFTWCSFWLHLLFILASPDVHFGFTWCSFWLHTMIIFASPNVHFGLFLLQHLRDKFIFKIVPMINPDGVIVGNYRCSLAARDLNRNYRRPRKEGFPTVWHIKEMMEREGKNREVCNGVNERKREIERNGDSGRLRKTPWYTEGETKRDRERCAVIRIRYNYKSDWHPSR